MVDCILPDELVAMLDEIAYEGNVTRSEALVISIQVMLDIVRHKVVLSPVVQEEN